MSDYTDATNEATVPSQPLPSLDPSSPQYLTQLEQRVAQLEQENARLKHDLLTSSSRPFSPDLPSVATSQPEPTFAPPSPSIDNLQLQREHYRFYQILMNSNAGLVIQLGPQHTFHFVNPLYERLVGRGKERLLGLSIYQAFPDLQGQGLYEIMDEVIRSGKPYVGKELPVQLVRQEAERQEEVYFTFTYHPLFNLEGHLEGFFTHALDVSEEVRARHALLQERQRLQEVFKNAPAAIATIKMPEYVFELVNEPYVQLVGRPAAGLVGKSVFEVLPEMVSQGFIERVEQVRTTGKPFIAQELAVYFDRKGDGTLEETFVNLVYQPLFTTATEAGLVTSVVESILIHANDVTEQVTSRKQIEQLSQLKDEFVAIASHDLRTPLTTIKGYNQLLERILSKYQQAQLTSSRPHPYPPLFESKQDPQAALSENGNRVLSNSLELVRNALSQIDRLGELLNRLLDFSQIREGQIKLQYEQAVDLVNLVQQGVTALNVMSEQHRVLMQPVSQPRITVACDPLRLEQVLNNLVTNAIKYSPAHTTITVGVEPPGFYPASAPATQQEVVIWVRDEGYGITAQQQTHLFERFYRVTNAYNASKGGLGLGLYISAEIVKQHGGRIWVESLEGQGSTFYVALPVKGQA